MDSGVLGRGVRPQHVVAVAKKTVRRSTVVDRATGEVRAHTLLCLHQNAQIDYADLQFAKWAPPRKRPPGRKRSLKAGTNSCAV